MSNLRFLSSIALVLGLAACGGSGTGGAASGDGTSSGGEHHHGGGHIAEIDALHDVLAPVFHGEAGSARAAAACEHASAFRERSAAIHAVATPEGVATDAWGHETSELVSRADALAAECTASGPEVESRFLAFHDSFHAVMELAGGHHEGDEHHGEGDHHEGDEHHADGAEHHDDAHHGEGGDHHEGDEQHADGAEHHDDAHHGEGGDHHEDDEHHADGAEHHDDAHHADGAEHHDDAHHGEGEHHTPATADAGVPHH